MVEKHKEEQKLIDENAHLDDLKHQVSYISNVNKIKELPLPVFDKINQGCLSLKGYSLNDGHINTLWYIY